MIFLCFGAVQVYLDGTPLKSSKDTLVHENVFYLLRSNVTDAVVYSFFEASERTQYSYS